MKPITEDKIEAFAIEQLNALGWEYFHGLVIAPGNEKCLNYDSCDLYD